MTPSLDTIRSWLETHMPSLHRETYSLRDKAAVSRLCQEVGMEHEQGEDVDLRVLHRRLKQCHFGG
jgi:hypothetical protein